VNEKTEAAKIGKIDFNLWKKQKREIEELK